ncbi:transcriptional regulator [Nocardia panacis]|uniref:Transcriptional regulator n=1 Tax=Nocardia panacis TaxID=2340916 RepID=A0A3A4KLV1_9NOCA|nr:SRPBCC family protein [Nocardia panacis]RJO76528.1 transcriptional regulator [Nocardia panacis]
MAEFEVVRQAVISAEPSRVHGLIDDFHRWSIWSPWEDMDPQMLRTFSGADAGVGAKYAWSGNRKVGSGKMEILSSTDREILLRLEFERPWKATNEVTFTLAPNGPATEVTWRMRGERRGLMGLLTLVMPMDRMIGRDFEKGLARLRQAAQN